MHYLWIKYTVVYAAHWHRALGAVCHSFLRIALGPHILSYMRCTSDYIWEWHSARPEVWQWARCRPWWNLLSSCKHGSNLLSFSKIPVKTEPPIRRSISNSFTPVMVVDWTPHDQERHNWSPPINNKKHLKKSEQLNGLLQPIINLTSTTQHQVDLGLVIDLVLRIQVLQSWILQHHFVE